MEGQNCRIGKVWSKNQIESYDKSLVALKQLFKDDEKKVTSYFIKGRITPIQYAEIMIDIRNASDRLLID